MHINNIKWLTDVKAKRPENFKDCSVLEIGSQTNEAFCARDLFENCHYIGVDIIPGRRVDIVSPAQTFQTSETFDTLVILSEFEHDPDWRLAFSNNLRFLKPGGLILLCWGAEGNLPHDPQPWAIVPAQEFADFAKTLPIKVIDAFFEEERYGANTAGAYDVEAIKL